MARRKKTLGISETKTTLPQVTPLSHDERNWLVGMFNDPTFKKAWNNASLAKPSLFRADKQLEGVNGLQLASNRLHQLQGWEMFSVALLSQVNDPKPARAIIRDNYPDSALP